MFMRPGRSRARQGRIGRGAARCKPSHRNRGARALRRSNAEATAKPWLDDQALQSRGERIDVTGLDEQAAFARMDELRDR
jgi:hypothetical protein